MAKTYILGFQPSPRTLGANRVTNPLPSLSDSGPRIPLGSGRATNPFPSITDWTPAELRAGHRIIPVSIRRGRSVR